MGEDLSNMDELERARSTIEWLTAEIDRLKHDRRLLLPLILEMAVWIVSAVSGSLLLLDETRQELVSEVAIGPNASEVLKLRIPVGQGIAGYVATTGEAQIMSVAEGDQKQAGDIASAMNCAPKSVLCVPLWGRSRIIGVLEVLDKKDDVAFDNDDIANLALFASLAAVVIGDSAVGPARTTAHRYYNNVPTREERELPEPELAEPTLPEVILLDSDIQSNLSAKPTVPPRVVRFKGSRQAPDVARDPVVCSVFARPKSKPGRNVLIQVFTHLATNEAAAEAREYAQEADEKAARRGATSLSVDVARGSMIRFELGFEDIPFDDRLRDIIWNGNTQSVQYSVRIPDGFAAESLVGRLEIYLESVPIGRIVFHIEMLEVAEGVSPGYIGVAAPVHKVFMSYTSEDRAEVLKRTQGLKMMGIEVFQDLLSLLPGEQWEHAIYREIDSSDLMLLCWSVAASKSDWVSREWRCALERRGAYFIKPLPLEKPIPAPPSELSHLHFNDWMLSVIRDEEASNAF